MFELNSDKIDEELKIDDSSPFMLCEELKNHARKEHKYQRLAAQANKEVAMKKLELEILAARIIQEKEEAGGGLSASAKQELRKTGITIDKRYQAMKREVIDAEERAGYLNGVVSSWISRGFRLLDLCKIADRVWGENLTVYQKTSKLDEILSKGT